MTITRYQLAFMIDAMLQRIRQQSPKTDDGMIGHPMYSTYTALLHSVVGWEGRQQYELTANDAEGERNKQEADVLVSLLNGYVIEQEGSIEKRLKELGFLLCSKWDRGKTTYSLSIPDPDLWKEPPE